MPQTQDIASEWLAFDDAKRTRLLSKMSSEQKRVLRSAIEAKQAPRQKSQRELNHEKPGLVTQVTTPAQKVGDVGRGAELGMWEGMGIVPSTDPVEVVTGTAKQFARGANELVEGGFRHVESLPGIRSLPGPLKDIAASPIAVLDIPASFIENAATSIETGLKSAADAYKKDDLEGAAEGLTSALTRIALLREAREAEPAPRAAKAAERVNKLAYASGRGTTDLVKDTLPDVMKTANAQTAPETVGEYQGVLRKAKKALNDEYSQTLGPHANDQFVTTSIADKIRDLITPNMAKTAAGRAEATAILRAAKEFEGRWTLGELDAERMDANARLNAYESKSPVDQYAAMKRSRSVAIDKAIADGIRQTVYPYMDQITGKPPGYFAGLKQKIGNFMELESKVDEQVKTLRDTSARSKGEPITERIGGGVSVSSTGRPHGYFRGLKEAILPRDPEKVANKSVKSAFKQLAPRKGVPVKSLPLSMLIGAGASKGPAPRAGNPTDDWAGQGPQ